MDRYTATIEAYNKLASAYQEKSMNLDLYDDTYDAFCQFINQENPSIFEIGCGPGNVTRQIIMRLPACNIDAIDMAPNMVSLARQNNPAANVWVMDCRDIDQLTKGYDAIMCAFCMPYLSKEDSTKLISDCAKLLVPNGVFYCSVIEDDYNKSGYETSSNGEYKMFVYCHQYDYLQEALLYNHFQVVEVTRRSYAKADGSTSTHLIIIAKKTDGI